MVNTADLLQALNDGIIAGIGPNIHWTFSILKAFIIFLNYKNRQNTIQILWSVLFILSVFVTVFLHGLVHALAAKNYHINTKAITLLPIGALARVDKIPEKPLEKLAVAIAGPLVNITLAINTGLFIKIPSDSNELMAKIIKWCKCK